MVKHQPQVFADVLPEPTKFVVRFITQHLQVLAAIQPLFLIVVLLVKQVTQEQQVVIQLPTLLQIIILALVAEPLVVVPAILREQQLVILAKILLVELTITLVEVHT